jgi:hypothetical protein
VSKNTVWSKDLIAKAMPNKEKIFFTVITMMYKKHTYKNSEKQSRKQRKTVQTTELRVLHNGISFAKRLINQTKDYIFNMLKKRKRLAHGLRYAGKT